MSITQLLGKTLIDVRRFDDEAIHFITKDLEEFKMYHAQDCCESVSIESIVGDLSDLIGSPIVRAEEKESTGNAEYGDTETWTFYTLATRKGYVDIRWYGTSNGYYSESVDFVRV